MTRSFAALVALPLAFPLAAAGATEVPVQARRLERNGEVYVYTTTVDGDRRVLQGRVQGSGERFRLIVDGRRVRGTVNGRFVSFVAAKRGPVDLASR